MESVSAESLEIPTRAQFVNLNYTPRWRTDNFKVVYVVIYKCLTTSSSGPTAGKDSSFEFKYHRLSWNLRWMLVLDL
jgi:hypothetical protein